MKDLFDLIIVGAGPAGSAASVYAARKHLKTLLITKEFGGQSVVSSEIQNWIGIPSISGFELAESFKKHVLSHSGDSLSVKEGHGVKKISKNEDGFSVETDNGEVFNAKTVLITSGSSRRKLDIPRAEKFEHKGITYCASCDGPFFAGQDLVVIGGGNAGFETAAQLLAYAKSVTLLNRTDRLKADPITVEKVRKNPHMTIILNAKPLEIRGENTVTGIVYEDSKGEKKEIEATGIFVEIGQIPNTGLVENLVSLDEYKRIKIEPRTQKTSLGGMWAAGDSTDVLYHQNNIAAGDAVRAIEDIYLCLHAR